MTIKKILIPVALVMIALLWGCEGTTTLQPTTIAPTTVAPTTLAPTTIAPTTLAPTTQAPTTLMPTTLAPTTLITTTAFSNVVNMPDLTGMSRAQIESTLTDLGLTVRWYFDNSVVYQNESEYDKFVKYGLGLEPGSIVEIGTEVRVYTTPLHLEVKYLYELNEYTDGDGNPLVITESDYSGKEFIADGIGVVTVDRYVDGDTTWFRSDRTSFSTRYLGIDTPESTALYEPWGKEAALYVQNKLMNAETIVLQAEGNRTDNNGRYLAWIWYRETAQDDFKLLNLELVELAYSKNRVGSESKFNDVLLLASWDASLTKRRVWGEIDPNYDYSKEGAQMTIQYLMENFEAYVGLKVSVTGIITRKIGNNIYLQDDNGYGVYVYIGWVTSSQLQLGVNLTLGGLVPTYYSGSPQLTNFNTKQLFLEDPIDMPDPLVITYNDLDFQRIGTLVQYQNLVITQLYQATSGATIRARDASYNVFVIRIDDSTLLTLDDLGLQVGNTITVTGPLSYYDYDYDGTVPDYVYLKSNYQLMLADIADITKH
jgi:micrococcal nuclease